MVMRWPGIQSAIDILKSTRLRVENVVNEGCKAFTGLKLSYSQDSQNYKRHDFEHNSNDNLSVNNLFNNNLCDNSLIKNCELPYNQEKKTPKYLHTTISEYWKDALYNHWLILIQGLILVILIMIISPWIGHDGNDDNYSVEDSYFDHRPDIHLKQLRKTLEDKSNSFSRKACGFFSFFSPGNDYNNYNKRSGILRRKRAYRRFY
ncbi:uncharacterized protein LOC127280687 isoform X2 [Leptopilina boulardi]|uniref:uncharacterized protein LOC127280687 isoform X2 n=1 Tax=Leptopilina boulardi TaxID=63433 RepID=UPI0021F516BA|nr:uncharacterized protein LOC127280687 isoform X2 [Leptopilina boulardi]